MDMLNRFISSEGRISRRTYVLTFLIPFVALLGLSALVFTLPFKMTGALPSSAAILPWMAFLATADAQNIKRWHDLGDPGRIYKLLRPGVVLLPVLAFALQFMFPAVAASFGDMDSLLFMVSQDLGGVTLGPVPLVLLGVTAVGVLGNVAWLSITPGQSGPNDHGPDPLGVSGVPGFGGAKPAAGDDDPVKRHLAEYQARQAQQARPAPAMVTQVRAAPGGTFGRKQT
ncbi:MAG: DUF805 domain-containing protein [Hyphomonadaceae bacterium]